MSTPVLTCKNLSKSFQRNTRTIPVLNEINLTVNSGETTIIRGKSGIGKSVLISLLAGLLQSDSGSIHFKNIELNKLSNHAPGQLRLNDIGVVFQNHNLLSSWTALENVMASAFNLNGRLAETKERAINLLSGLGLKSRMHHFPYEMSMGEQQRIAIVRLLMTSPGTDPG